MSFKKTEVILNQRPHGWSADTCDLNGCALPEVARQELLLHQTTRPLPGDRLASLSHNLLFLRHRGPGLWLDSAVSVQLLALSTALCALGVGVEVGGIEGSFSSVWTAALKVPWFPWRPS